MGTTIVLKIDQACDPNSDRLEQWAQGIISIRDRRAQAFGSDLFHDLSWDLILHLAIAPQAGFTRTELSLKTKASEEAIRRWLCVLELRGLVSESLDLRYQLTPKAEEALRATLPLP